jgi:hypothetical protein
MQKLYTGYILKDINYFKFKIKLIIMKLRNSNVMIKFRYDSEQKTVHALAQESDQSVDPKDRKVLAIGISKTNPKDHYNKLVGRQLALGRCLRNLKLSVEDRKLAWEDYHANHRSTKNLSKKVNN